MRDFCLSKLAYLALGLSIFLVGCKSEMGVSYTTLQGKTWGTYYKITYQGGDKERHEAAILDVLKDFDTSVSTYVPDSYISQFNAAEKEIEMVPKYDVYFANVLTASKALKQSTDGYLDVSVMPLLNYWGFGYKGKKRVENVDSTLVNELRALLDLEGIQRVERGGKIFYTKNNPRLEIDFSALAKGYGIDVIADYFDRRNITNYLIDIGGEVRAKGVNAKKKVWTLAINKPYKDAAYTAQELILKLDNKSIATSGNYREMYEVNGRVYGHILDPLTGYPGTSDVLSASIIAADCMTADALATACIAAGKANAIQLMKNHPNAAACLIYDANGDEQLEKVYLNNFEQYVIDDLSKHN